MKTISDLIRAAHATSLGLPTKRQYERMVMRSQFPTIRFMDEPEQLDLVGLAHTPQFYTDYRDWLIEGGYDPEIDRFDSRHEPLAIDFFKPWISEA